MAVDTERNGNQLPASVTGSAEAEGHFYLSRVEGVEESITPTYGRGRGVGNTIMSSLMSSTNRISALLSPNISPPLQTAFTNGDITGAVSSMPLGLGLTDLSVTRDLFNVVSDLEFVTNSTLSFHEPSNETLQRLPSSLLPEEIGAIVVVSLVVPFILLSNIVVIVSVVRFRRLHTPTNYFITSLAAVDIFVALASPIGIVVEVFNFGGAVLPEDAVICLLPNRVLMMACGVSVLTLAAIAYDRQTALVSPLEYVRVMTYRKVTIMVTLIWMYSALIAWLPLMLGWYSLPSENSSCSANLINGKAPILFLAAIFAPSCVAIFVCYSRIFIVARHHAKAIAAVEFAIHRHLQVKFIVKDTKYAKTLALVIGVFLLLWLPYLVFTLAQTATDTKLSVWVQTYLTLLTVINSGINPWLYAFKNNELRAAFKRLFRELCSNNLCNFSNRRTSLISAVSGTPRLSRMDSRVASMTQDLSQCIVNEKLRLSVHGLSEQIEEKKWTGQGKQHRRQSMVDVMSVQPSCGWPMSLHRQATSCSNLEALGEARAAASGHINTETKGESARTCHGRPAGHVCPGKSASLDGNQSCVNITSGQSTTLSSTALTNPPPSISQANAQPPQPPFPRRSSSTDSNISTLSVSDLVDQPKHHHQTSVPSKPPSLTDQITTERQVIRYVHSVDILKESAQPAASWTDMHWPGKVSDSSTHSYFQTHHHHPTHSLSFVSPKSSRQCAQHTLTHTHSCPIFEPITSYNWLLPQLYSGNESFHLRKAASCLLEDRLDFVSRVHKDADNSHRDQYVV